MRTHQDPYTDDTEAAPGAVAGYRSGAAARLSGVPVETLRVWERRYAVTAPARTANRQRVYSFDDVRRLGLIKQLVDLGNPIGVLARLPWAELDTMLVQARGQAPGLIAAGAAQPAPQALRLALVGPALAQRVASALTHSGALQVNRTHASLESAAEALLGAAVDVLVIELGEVNEPLLPVVDALRIASGAQAVLLLYRFCTARTLRLWRKAGYLLTRAPAEAAEIESLCLTAFSQAGQRARQPSAPPAGLAAVALPAPARRFDDQSLALLALASHTVACECPRHVIDILLTLGSFERYSAQCDQRHPADAALHQDLQRTTGQARALFEQALMRLALAEGLPLPAQGALADVQSDPGPAA